MWGHQFIYDQETLEKIHKNAGFKNITIQFLEKNSIDYSKIFMRDNGDPRPNEIIKKEIFFKEIKPKWDVIFAIDDNPASAKMYNEDLGLNCLLVKNSLK